MGTLVGTGVGVGVGAGVGVAVGGDAYAAITLAELPSLTTVETFQSN